MSKDWYFSLKDDGKVEAICRAAGDDGLIGDVWREIGPGEGIDGVPHDELLAAGGGVLKLHDGGHEIVKPRGRRPEPPRGRPDGESRANRPLTDGRDDAV